MAAAPRPVPGSTLACSASHRQNGPFSSAGTESISSISNVLGNYLVIVSWPFGPVLEFLLA